MSRGPAHPAPLCLAHVKHGQFVSPHLSPFPPCGPWVHETVSEQTSQAQVCHESLQEHSGHKQAQEAITLHAEVLHRGTKSVFMSLSHHLTPHLYLLTLWELSFL